MMLPNPKGLCPFHLDESVFELHEIREENKVPTFSYRCIECKELVPNMYVTDYSKLTPIVLSAVGFRGHGKTVYFASLFRFLRKYAVNYWTDYVQEDADGESMEIIKKLVDDLAKGDLPNSTPKVL